MPSSYDVSKKEQQGDKAIREDIGGLMAELASKQQPNANRQGPENARPPGCFPLILRGIICVTCTHKTTVVVSPQYYT